MKFLLIVLFVLSLVACQSKKAALEIVCDSPNAPGVSDATPDQKAMRIAKHIESNVSNPDIQKLFTSMASMTPDGRVTAVRGVMEETGVTECPLLTVWDTPTKAKPVEK